MPAHASGRIKRRSDTLAQFQLALTACISNRASQPLDWAPLEVITAELAVCVTANEMWRDCTLMDFDQMTAATTGLRVCRSRGVNSFPVYTLSDTMCDRFVEIETGTSTRGTLKEISST